MLPAQVIQGDFSAHQASKLQLAKLECEQEPIVDTWRLHDDSCAASSESRPALAAWPPFPAGLKARSGRECRNRHRTLKSLLSQHHDFYFRSPLLEGLIGHRWRDPPVVTEKPKQEQDYADTTALRPRGNAQWLIQNNCYNIIHSTLLRALAVPGRSLEARPM